MGVELIMGMEEVINYLNGLQEENKKLKEQNDCLQRQIESVCKANDKLKEENKKLQHDHERPMLAYKTFHSADSEEYIGWVKGCKIYEELEEKLTTLQNQYDMAIQIDNKEIASLKEENKKLSEDYQKNSEASDILEDDGKEWNGNEWVDEEELSKYEKEDSDWARGYGFTIKDGEYRIHMAGGGDHWEDYVLTRDRNFIHNGLGKHTISTFVSCPDGNYLKVVHIGETYEPEEGEIDMYEMITENYQEEIIEYCDDEEPIEEPDSP